MRKLCSCLKSHFTTRLLPLLIFAGDAQTASIVVPTAPVITTQPLSLTLNEGQSFSFRTATGFWSYQWRKDGVEIPNATAANYDVRSVKFGDAGSYAVIVSDGSNSVTSAPPSTLSVNPRIPYEPYAFHTVAQTSRPTGIALDAAGNIYVVESIHNRIRKISAVGFAMILAGPTEIVEGTPTGGFADGIGSSARFKFSDEPGSVQEPYPGGGIAVDLNGNVYVADTFNCAIRKITPDGVVSTVAGDPSAANRYGFVDGNGYDARFAMPMGVAADKNGDIFVADTFNGAIRKVTPSGVVTTIIPILNGEPQPGRFYGVVGIAVNQDGDILVAASAAIQKVTPQGIVTTLAGKEHDYGFADGTGSSAQFSLGCYWYDEAGALAMDREGNVYVADTWTGTIRKVTAAGVVTTLGGSGVFVPNPLNESEGGGCTLGSPSRCITVPPGGYAEGAGAAALFQGPSGIAVGSDGTIFVADRFNDAIRIGSPAAVLQVSQNGSQLTLSWSEDPAGFTLQWTSNLSDDAQWADSEIAPILRNGRFAVTTTMAITAQFYRLKK